MLFLPNYQADRGDKQDQSDQGKEAFIDLRTLQKWRIFDPKEGGKEQR